jgi:hypothetical protein
MGPEAGLTGCTPKSAHPIRWSRREVWKRKIVVEMILRILKTTRLKEGLKV